MTTINSTQYSNNNIPLRAIQLREITDPNEEWLSDDDILRILHKSNGDMRRAVLKCLYKVKQKAFEKHDRHAQQVADNKLYRLDRGTLHLHF